ncbi:MAG: single-stranded DNA-binding protein [Anaerolineales bacterium]|nr:single-stranded DNA-binding protein [Anaerolineales bacterium]
MSRSLNKVMIIGNLGREPEMRYTPSGKPLTKFRVATNRRWTTPDGEEQTETEWFNVVTWGKLAEICNQYLTKGERVYIEGRLHTRHWTDEDGNHQSATEVVAQEMIMLGSPSQTDDQKTENIREEDEFPF